MIQKAKLLWEIVRQKDLSSELRAPKLQELMETITGKINEVCFETRHKKIMPKRTKYAKQKKRNILNQKQA
jgi:hypothetical protein